MHTGQHEHPTLTTAFKNVYGCMDTSWERDKGNPILTVMVIPQERAATQQACHLHIHLWIYDD